MKGYTILLLHVFSFGKVALSQTVFEQNSRYIDSVEQLIRTGWCKDTIAYNKALGYMTDAAVIEKYRNSLR